MSLSISNGCFICWDSNCKKHSISEQDAYIEEEKKRRIYEESSNAEKKRLNEIKGKEIVIQSLRQIRDLGFTREEALNIWRNTIY